jgi:hypothetical protein
MTAVKHQVNLRQEKIHFILVFLILLLRRNLKI